jgi:hypothetical protein
MLGRGDRRKLRGVEVLELEIIRGVRAPDLSCALREDQPPAAARCAVGLRRCETAPHLLL